jgi:predicted nucleic acid-binding Zn ribbon protein
MSEVVHHHGYNKSQSDLTRYSYMCDECGVAFQSLDEYVEHYKDYHPRSIGTAIT